jgi:hypothetical protein
VFSPRSKASPISAHAPQEHFAKKGERTFPHIVASVGGPD